MSSVASLAAAHVDGAGGLIAVLPWLAIAAGVVLLLAAGVTAVLLVVRRARGRGPVRPTVPGPPPPRGTGPTAVRSGPRGRAAGFGRPRELGGPPDPVMMLPTVPLYRVPVSGAHPSRPASTESATSPEPTTPTGPAPSNGEPPAAGTGAHPARRRRPAPPVRVSLSQETRPLTTRMRRPPVPDEHPTGPLPISGSPTP
jgi:hypothetical protein